MDLSNNGKRNSGKEGFNFCKNEQDYTTPCLRGRSDIVYKGRISMLQRHFQLKHTQELVKHVWKN